MTKFLTASGLAERLVAAMPGVQPVTNMAALGRRLANRLGLKPITGPRGTHLWLIADVDRRLTEGLTQEVSHDAPATQPARKARPRRRNFALIRAAGI